MDEKSIVDKTVRGFGLLAADAGTLTNLRFRSIRKFAETDVRNIRGRKCKTFASFCDEVAAALQFPYYFGENPAALAECLSDLEWIRDNNIFILCEDAHLLFTEEREPLSDFALIVRLFQRAQDYWQGDPSEGWSEHREPRGFKLLFQVDPQLFGYVRAIIEMEKSPWWHVDSTV